MNTRAKITNNQRERVKNVSRYRSRTASRNEKQGTGKRQEKRLSWVLMGIQGSPVRRRVLMLQSHQRITSTIMPRGGAALPTNGFIYGNKWKKTQNRDNSTQRWIGSMWIYTQTSRNGESSQFGGGAADVDCGLMHEKIEETKSELKTLECGNFPQYKRW